MDGLFTHKWQRPPYQDCGPCCATGTTQERRDMSSDKDLKEVFEIPRTSRRMISTFFAPSCLIQMHKGTLWCQARLLKLSPRRPETGGFVPNLRPSKLDLVFQNKMYGAFVCLDQTWGTHVKTSASSRRSAWVCRSAPVWLLMVQTKRVPGLSVWKL